MNKVASNFWIRESLISDLEGKGRDGLHRPATSCVQSAVPQLCFSGPSTVAVGKCVFVCVCERQGSHDNRSLCIEEFPHFVFIANCILHFGIMRSNTHKHISNLNVNPTEKQKRWCLCHYFSEITLYYNCRALGPYNEGGGPGSGPTPKTHHCSASCPTTLYLTLSGLFQKSKSSTVRPCVVYFTNTIHLLKCGWLTCLCHYVMLLSMLLY